MVLTDIQAKDILSNPKHKHELASAKILESSLRVFTEELDKQELQKEPYWTLLLKTIESRISKFDRVCDFIRYPLPVVQITDSIIGDFYKVFDGKNKYFNVEGDRDLTRLKTWINEKNLEQWIEDNARQVFKNKPISFVVVDSFQGNPICILIDSTRIVDAGFKNKQESELEYIAFLHSITVDPVDPKKRVTRYAVYDDENYHIFIKDDAGNYIKDDELSGKHTIGYCPATAFIQESNNSKNQYKRRTAFGSSISKLEDWTIFDIFRNYVDHYAPFPVTESIVSKCGNPKCEDGAVKVSETILEGVDKGKKKTKYTKCEVCDGQGKGKQYVGPGTHIRIKYQPSNTVNDGSGKFKMIFPDTDKLDYTPKKLDELETEITYKTVGINTMINKEAINEIQAKGSFVSMDTVLLRNKSMLDSLYIFIVKTSGRMMYKNLTIKIDANHGTEWYLMSEEDLQARFDNAKKIGLPINEVTSIYKQLIETKYSNNKSKRDQEIMLVDLQDYPFYSIDEIIKLKNESSIDDFQLSLKANFHNFVKRFERENGPITLFGINLDYSKRIELIKETLETYNAELIAAKTERNSPDDGNGEVVVTQEQLDAQANLRGTVGGVQGIILLQQGMADGTTSREAAIATMVEIYGFNEAKAGEILGVKSTILVPPATPPIRVTEE